MFRLLAIVATALTFASAFVLYRVKYDTRLLETQVQAKERAIEKMQGDIAVLKAEKAYLSRPERIEALARKQGLEPIREQQYVRFGDIGSDRDSGGDARTGAK
jgi:cell division protein FtsL